MEILFPFDLIRLHLTCIYSVAAHLGMYYMKRNRSADAWKSLVMIGSMGKEGVPFPSLFPHYA
jgi:hypothetical protein